MGKNFGARPAQMLFGKIDDMLGRVAHGVGKARAYLFAQQHEDGYWCGELEADTTLESDYIAIHTLLGTGNRSRMERAVPEIIRHQNADGGWPIYAGGPSNISASVKAYFALKLMGYKPDHPVLERARTKIAELGGATECNTFTKIYLCFLGQYDWEAVPAVPPEIVLFPNWFWFNLYEISSWSRAILVPLSIAYAKKPFKKIPAEMGIDELFIGGRHGKHLHLKWSAKKVSWRNFFLVLNRVVHFCERFNIRPLRYLALKKAERWMLDRFEKSDGLGAIYWIFAMQCKNGGWASFDKDNTRMVFQHIPFADHNAMLDPPTVDITGRVLEMLAAYGVTKEDTRVKKAIQFILSEQEPDGSWFGRWGVNYIYGTMLVLRGLQAMGVDNHEPYIQQAAEWLRMVQNSDGGWGESCGSYDDPTTRGIGPSTPSQTAWAVMGLLAAGDTRSESVQRGILYLLETQRLDGHWEEEQYTGTGFPRVFYLAYHLYRDYFPLIALSTYSREFSALYEEGSVGYARG